MKKFIAIILTLVIALSFSANVFAADEPPTIEPLANIEPGYSAKCIELPNGSDSFDYSFSYYKNQYSDFLFKFDNSTTAVHMLFWSYDSTDYTMTVNIVNAASDKIVRTFTATVNDGSASEYTFMAYQLTDHFTSGDAYYIKLSNPSVAYSTGTVSIY